MLSMLMPELTVGRKNAASARSTCSIAARLRWSRGIRPGARTPGRRRRPPRHGRIAMARVLRAVVGVHGRSSGMSSPRTTARTVRAPIAPMKTVINVVMAMA